MSETVHYKGKLKKIEFDEQMGFIGLESKCKHLMNNLGYIELPEYYDTWEEYLREELYEKYIISGCNIYNVQNVIHIDDDNIFYLHDNKDGTYDFDVMYYNGGCSFTEAIDIAFNDMN